MEKAKREREKTSQQEKIGEMEEKGGSGSECL